MTPSPKIDKRVDPQRLAPAFELDGRLHIPDFFEARFARHVLDALTGPVPWARTMVVQGKGVEAPLQAMANAPQQQRMVLEAHVADIARKGFQYKYDAWRLSDNLDAGRRAGGALAPIEAVYDF